MLHGHRVIEETEMERHCIPHVFSFGEHDAFFKSAPTFCFALHNFTANGFIDNGIDLMMFMSEKEITTWHLDW